MSDHLNFLNNLVKSFIKNFQHDSESPSYRYGIWGEFRKRDNVAGVQQSRGGRHRQEMSRWPSPPRHIHPLVRTPPLIWNTVAPLSIYFNKSAVREYISASANPSKERDKEN
ncbi:hypothetical protein ABEB36_002811 [Hypothenemus hampei]|uniref:Uncharacterized protein n=1 Tax=Hypothenemus hampei TaxID=57062 RepID=A0ABD1F722_HYPHA